MKTLTRETYAKRIERVSEYLINHLDDDLDLHRLAEEAYFSAYHFHRIYHMIVGETVAETLRRLRLHRAAVKLISSDTDVTTLAYEAGYHSVQAFSRAFRLSYGLAPTDYRQKQFRHASSVALRKHLLIQSNKENNMHQVSIEHTKACRVAAIQHDGDYMDIGNTFERIMIWAAGQNLLNDTTRSFGIYYDDPAAVPTAKLRSDACIAIPENITLPAEYRVLQTYAGRCAVLIHVGPYSDLEKSYQWLYGVWLPKSGEEPANAPPFEEYLNDPRQVAPSALRTAIYLPLKG